jgi:hypothetical protein
MKTRFLMYSFTSIGWIQFLPRQGNNSQNWPMAWQRWWPMAIATAMAHGDGDGNGQQQGQQQWWWLTATQQRWRQQWLRMTATAMADGNGDGNMWLRRQRVTVTAAESATAKKMATVMAMVMATVRATITKEGLPLHVVAMCSAFGGAAPCLHPHGHKGKCMHHRGDIGKSVCSSYWGRVPDS